MAIDRQREEADALVKVIRPIRNSEPGLGHLMLENPVSFAVDKGTRVITRTVRLKGTGLTSSKLKIPRSVSLQEDSDRIHDLSFLRCKQSPSIVATRGRLRIVDLFSGCGGMTLGVWEACRALQLEMQSLLAVDINQVALDVYGTNFGNARLLTDPIETQVDGKFNEAMTPIEKRLLRRLGSVDMVIGGPPCQGHSDLNNHTRRSDPKNRLILKLVRFVELVRPRYIMIENVQGIRHDKNNAAGIARHQLERLGYYVQEGLIPVTSIGVPQRRRRFVMVASSDTILPIPDLIAGYETRERDVQWACADLLDLRSEEVFNTAASHTETNRRRIEYLFKHELYELPDHMRPDCHKYKDHSYNSVYGRMRWDEPAPTITTGFGSPGQGRFVHSLRPRTLTPHEAARIQFIPDFFDFGSSKRQQLQEMIGNAVPPKLAFVLALELMR